MLDDNTTSRNARRSGDDGADMRDGESEFSGTALSVPETDPERIAFNLWNEGRVDEAIQFLEREIAGRQARYDAIPEPPALAQLEQRKVEPVSDWRERHRSALSPADFNAFGRVRQIDLVAKPADAILPHPPRRSLRAGWIMGLVLVFVGLSAGAMLWTGGETQQETPLPEVQPTAQVAPATIVPVTEVKPESEVATVEPERVLPPEDQTGTVLPPEDVTDAAAPPDSVAPPETSSETQADVAAAPPPEEETGTVLPPEEVTAAVAPPDSVVPPETSSEAEAEVADAPPPDDELPPEDIAANPVETGPETTASIDPAPADAEQAPVVVARVPRQRPEPPATTRAERPATTRAESPATAQRSARVERRAEPRIVYEPTTSPRRVTRAPELQFDPINPRPTLTPAEHQLLLKRRAWAQNYSARRRAYAERRVVYDEPSGLFGNRGPLIRLFRD